MPDTPTPEFPNQAPIDEERRARFEWASRRRSHANPKQEPPDAPEE